jgi:CO/xanthine dehydrogenase FAD-binding subunit
LIALDAQLRLVSKGGERTLPINEFFQDYYETAIQPGELLTEVIVPPVAADARTIYLKFLPRTADDYATVAVAAKAQLEDGTVRNLRVALGAAGRPARRLPRLLRLQTRHGRRLHSPRARASAVVVHSAKCRRQSAEYLVHMQNGWSHTAQIELAGPGAALNPLALRGEGYGEGSPAVRLRNTSSPWPRGAQSKSPRPCGERVRERGLSA